MGNADIQASLPPMVIFIVLSKALSGSARVCLTQGLTATPSHTQSCLEVFPRQTDRGTPQREGKLRTHRWATLNARLEGRG